MTQRKRLLVASLLLLWGLAGAWVAWRNVRDEPDLAPGVGRTNPAPETDPIAKGAYLARAGNCMACHTSPGGEPFAGGRGISTPFGTVFTSNLTPDQATGLGNWTPAEFWRALHNGRSRDGRLLYPAFPYTSYSGLTRDDADALFAYLSSLTPVRQAPTPHQLRWPYNSQVALAVWRALYFSPRSPEAVMRPGVEYAEWNRGAYLVQTLGHCSACHGQRNALGAIDPDLAWAGGLMPLRDWYAPSLSDTREASVKDWPRQEIVTLLQTGISALGAVTGPMAEVVQHSTQYLSDADLRAMATFLKDLPGKPSSHSDPVAQVELAEIPGVPTRIAERGAKLYEQHCAGCHGEQGLGVAGAYPALAGNRAVTLRDATNLIQVVLYGGFAPSTAGNPRPYGMPPYLLQLSNADVAAVITHLRKSWGNQAAPVSEQDVNRLRDQVTP